MPPQSRGVSPEGAPFSNEPGTPALRQYLNNLPTPRGLIPDQRTPTSRRSTVSAERDVPTPTRMHFTTGPEEEEEEEEEEGEEREDEDDSVTLDDEEFESHYSRRSSSASDNGDDDDDDDDDIPEPMSAPPSFPTHSNRLQRISSLPISHQPLSQHTLATSQSSTSLRLPPPPPPPLYPPFYNRPPTPLPPSPSLTSLLRPPSILNRSTTSTRPTTPDSSDVETPLDTEAAVAHSARRAHPLPPTSPKVPTYEYYGFVLYLASTLAFTMYILWSYLPSPFLHALGITYYPNRYWSLAIPAWIVMVLIFIYIALLSYNVEYLTLPLTSLECMVDDAGNVAVLDEQGRVRQGGSKRVVQDIEMRRRLEDERERRRVGGGHGGGGGGSGGGSWGKHSHANSSKRKKREKERERNREREDEWFGFGYAHAHTHAGSSPAGGSLSWKQIWNHGTDGVMDVPIGGVCEVLYADT